MNSILFPFPFSSMVLPLFLPLLPSSIETITREKGTRTGTTNNNNNNNNSLILGFTYLSSSISITPLVLPTNYTTTCLLLIDLYQQQIWLHSHGYMMYSFDPQCIYQIQTKTTTKENKVIIEKDNYICLDSRFLHKVNSIKTMEITFLHPFLKNEFCEKSISSIQQIPSSPIPHSYYSLISLCFYFMFQQTTYKKSRKEIYNILQSMKGTKLYACFYRILIQKKKQCILL